MGDGREPIATTKQMEKVDVSLVSVGSRNERGRAEAAQLSRKAYEPTKAEAGTTSTSTDSMGWGRPSGLPRSLPAAT